MKIYIADTGFGDQYPPVFSGTQANTSNGNHGTMMCTIVRCVSPDSDIKPVDFGIISNEAVINVLNWLIKNTNKEDIVLFSITMANNEKFKIIKDLFVDLSNQTTVVCAAGNAGGPVEDLIPAGLDTVLTVGSLNKSRKIASHTSTGQINAYAPGTNININGYNRSGTSIAASIFTGFYSINRDLPSTQLAIHENFISLIKNKYTFVGNSIDLHGNVGIYDGIYFDAPTPDVHYNVCVCSFEPITHRTKNNIVSKIGTKTNFVTLKEKPLYSNMRKYLQNVTEDAGMQNKNAKMMYDVLKESDIEYLYNMYVLSKLKDQSERLHDIYDYVIFIRDESLIKTIDFGNIIKFIDVSTVYSRLKYDEFSCEIDNSFFICDTITFSTIGMFFRMLGKTNNEIFYDVVPETLDKYLYCCLKMHDICLGEIDE